MTTGPGAVFELNVEGKELGFFETAPYPFKGLVPRASAENVQAALEGVYGPGNVQVSGPESALVVRSVGEDEYEVVNQLKVGVIEIGSASAHVVTGAVFKGSELAVTATNVGDATAEAGSDPLRVVDRLPKGLRALFAHGTTRVNGSQSGAVRCSVGEAGQLVECVLGGSYEPNGFGGREVPAKVPMFNQVEVVVGVEVEGAVSGELNEVSVSGAGAPPARSTHAIVVSGSPTQFGVEEFEQVAEEVGGAPDQQAGSHPFQYTTTVNLNEAIGPDSSSPSGEAAKPAALVKDLTFKLPPGLIGNPTAIPRCPLKNFVAEQKCAADTVIGYAAVTFYEGQIGGTSGLITVPVPVFNVEPAVGEAARFAFAPGGVPVYLSASVSNSEDYRVTVHVANIPQAIGFLNTTLTLWGVPGDTRHEKARSIQCIEAAAGLAAESTCPAADITNPPPFLILPTSCTSELQSVVEGDSWQQEGTFKQLGTSLMPALGGCSSLPFSGEIQVSPDEQSASTPSGLSVDVKVPQQDALNATGLAPSALRDIKVVLPEGVALNPAASDGLQACSEEQVGLNNGLEVACPNASKIATVTIHTPLLPNPLKGFAYLAQPQNFPGAPQENPFQSLVAIYVVARDPISGVTVKLAGQITLSPTGQITTTFTNNPQLPFETAELAFFGGERAPLSTPASCRLPGGEGYVTHATFTPWSGTPTAPEITQASSEFDITSGANGTPCPGPSLPFTPTLQSGVTNVNAGSFSELTTTLSREDGQQSLSGVQLQFPPGLSGLLDGVKLCGEPQANEGTCPAESEIGETIVSVGLGGDPFTVTGGKVYITGPYDGAPFGLSIVNPAKAGPFVLQQGRPVVVRARIEVNPRSAALTVVTDPVGSPHAIPTIVEGVPLQIKHVYVTVNRPRFVFNPTNCDPLKLTGSIESTQGALAPQALPFQVTNCAALSFKPQFQVQTGAKPSRITGASLHVTLDLPYNPGSGANVARVKVSLPKQLPSPLKTLQKACTEKTFEEDPAHCPEASRVGEARVSTPVLEGALTGPAYFVSYGGAKYPELVVVLTGEDGVTVQVHGETFISKQGITTATFSTVPDVPFTTFEMTLPQREYPALTANGNLCQAQAAGKLLMPTELVGQNGSKLEQSTKIAVTGCPKSSHPKHKRKHANKHTKKAKRKP
ncbi:MAG TPA: hypothetical protein VG147_13735 [Solirubrobacteraceae bacterium]|nr:hypothetical protein [Solirubrobacteraceae bacterium]